MNIPQVYDAGRRAARTFIQVLLAFPSFALIYPAIVAAFGVPTSSRIGIYLAASVLWVAGAAAVISRLMAIPAVNALLGRIKLDGHSGAATPQDSLTRALILPALAASDADH